MDPKKAGLVGLAVAIVAGMIVGGVYLGRKTKDAVPATPTLSPTVSDLPTRSASASASTSTSPKASSPSPSGEGASGTIVTADGQILKGVNGTPKGVGIDAPCGLLADPGWSAGCGSVPMAGGRAAWVVQSKPVTGSSATAWVGRVFVYVPAAGAWVPRLEASDPDGTRWSQVAVKTNDLTHDGRNEIVFGFRFRNSQNSLGLDLVTWQSGSTPVVSAHPDNLTRGSAQVGAGQVDLFDPSAGKFRHQIIRWDGAHFRIRRVADVAAVPASDF